MSRAVLLRVMTASLNRLAGVAALALLAFMLGVPVSRTAPRLDPSASADASRLIAANQDRHSSDVRAGQQVELITTEQRAIARIASAADDECESRVEPPRACANDSSRWCDVVQCRRLAGALLLGYATPPPARISG